MSNSDRLTGPDFLDSVADQSAAQGLPVNAAEFRQRATDWRADQARIEQLEADLARLERQLRSDTERARIKAALTAAQQQGQAVAWQDEWRAAVAAKLSSYGLSEEAAAVFAESELGEYRAGLCDCAENDPADMVDLMMGVALDAIEKWKAESAGRPFGYKRTALPSAPVGVEGFEQWYARVDARFWNNWDACNAAFHAGKRSALAQQPAASVGEEIMVNTPYDVFTLPLQPSGLNGNAPRFVVHVPGPEAQPAEAQGVVDEPLSHADLCRLSRVFNAHNVPGLDQDRRINEWLGKRIAESLTGERNE